MFNEEKQSTAYDPEITSCNDTPTHTTTKALHMITKISHIMTEVQIMIRVRHITRKALHIMENEPHIMKEIDIRECLRSICINMSQQLLRIAVLNFNEP